jgi:hypothetical protein
VNEGKPTIGVANSADEIAEQFIASRTRFSRVPTDLMEARAALAAVLGGAVFADGFESGDAGEWSAVVE